jgi:hypothetical protein
MEFARWVSERPKENVFRLSRNSEELATYSRTQLKIPAGLSPEDVQPKVDAALDYAGLRYLVIQYDFQEHELPFGRFRFARSTDLSEWLPKFLNVKSGVHIRLVPDTNFLIRRYATNVFLPVFETHRIGLWFPRLAILEVEALTNRNKRDPRRAWKARQAYACFGEILRLQELGAQLLPETNPEVLESFSKISGEGYADAWIRREIGVWKKQLRNEEVRFVSTDLANTFAAIAEGIQTVFIGVKKETDYVMSCGGDRFAAFVAALALYLESVTLEMTEMGQSSTYRVDGHWPAKTLYEWKTDSVMIAPSP